jgi:hypothetical protein
MLKIKYALLGIIGFSIVGNNLLPLSASAVVEKQSTLQLQNINSFRIANSELEIPDNLPKNSLDQTPPEIAQIVPKKVSLEFGRLTLRHPADWVGTLQARGARNTTDIYMLGNTREFSGSPDQILLRIFEPVDILEKAQVKNYRPKDALSTYIKFLQSENGRKAISPKQIQQRQSGGRTFWTWQQSKQFEITWIGFVNEYGILNVIAVGTGKNQFSRFADRVYAVAQTTTYIPPSRQLDSPERAVSNYFKIIQSGDLSTARQQFCSSNRTLIDSFERYIGGGNGGSLLNTYFKLASTMNSADLSDLYYETKYYDESPGRAIVRISGNASFKDARGRTLVIPYNQLNRLKNDYFRLIREGGDWKICDDIFGR